MRDNRKAAKNAAKRKKRLVKAVFRVVAEAAEVPPAPNQAHEAHEAHEAYGQDASALQSEWNLQLQWRRPLASSCICSGTDHSLGQIRLQSVLRVASVTTPATLELRPCKNSVTGERMQVWVKDLLQVLEKKKARPKAAAPNPLSKCAKPIPAPKAQSNSAGSGLEKAQTMDTESQGPATPPQGLEGDANETHSVVSIQSSAPALSAVSSPVASLRGLQQGAAANSSGLKRPASKMKKPASKVQKVSAAWKPSPSFGFVKATKAKAKSYIVSRESMEEDFHLLVNVTAHASHSHHQVVEKLMALVTSQGGLNKAKAFFALLLQLACAEWGPVQYWYGRLSAPSGVACKRPRLPAIHEQDGIGFGGGRASSDPPRPPTPPRPRRRNGGGGSGGPGAPVAPDRLMEALNSVSQMLSEEQPEKKYEKKGFRSAIRRQLKKLCNRYQLRYPPWLDGSDLTVKQYKLRVRWFIEDFMLQQAHHAQTPQSPQGDGLGKACTPPASPRDDKPQSGVSTPTGAGSPIGSDDDSSSSSSESSGRCRPPQAPTTGAGTEAPATGATPTGEPCEPPATEPPATGEATVSSARVIGHLMENLLDNIEALHPGVREEVQENICGAPVAPEQGWPEEGQAASSSSLGTAGPAGDPRATKSEPPCSPRPMEMDSPEPGSAGLEILAEPAVEIPCVEPAEPDTAPPEAMETATVATPSSWPAEGPNDNMDGSWHLTEVPTDESVEMED
eukprot:s298_g39.t1